MTSESRAELSRGALPKAATRMMPKGTAWRRATLAGFAMLILFCGGCAGFWRGFASGITGSNQPQEKIGEDTGEVARQAISCLPFGDLVVGGLAILGLIFGKGKLDERRA